MNETAAARPGITRRPGPVTGESPAYSKAVTPPKPRLLHHFFTPLHKRPLPEIRTETFLSGGKSVKKMNESALSGSLYDFERRFDQRRALEWMQENW